ncbi:hypothetical protein DFH08DRAFT_814683 [Mycena albidolilacea]|uniref:Uncharacterized protein n=1 Tax=Mycena albidolilacea TaxID=1033008 RepID=A0AAD7ELF2_9AGAR|nr:hypothetical protein DFH08DRAFT_814683 [Mycena albidolilacea]
MFQGRNPSLIRKPSDYGNFVTTLLPSALAANSFAGANNYYLYTLPTADRIAILNGMQVLRTWVTGVGAGQKVSNNIAETLVSAAGGPSLDLANSDQWPNGADIVRLNISAIHATWPPSVRAILMCYSAVKCTDIQLWMGPEVTDLGPSQSQEVEQ